MGTSTSSINEKPSSGVWQFLSAVLAKHFSPADAAKVQEQLIKVGFLSSLGTVILFSWHLDKLSPFSPGL